MEWTNLFTKKMNKLEKAGKLVDTELKDKVMDKMYELSDGAGDEALDLYDTLEFEIDTTTDDGFIDYWYGIHALADMILQYGGIE